MKKVVTLGLALVIALGTLVGCGSNPNTNVESEAIEDVMTTVREDGVIENIHEEIVQPVEEATESNNEEGLEKIEVYYFEPTEPGMKYEYIDANGDTTTITLDLFIGEKVCVTSKRYVIDNVASLKTTWEVNGEIVNEY